MAEFEDDGRDLYDQAQAAMAREFRSNFQIWDFNIDDVDEIDTPPTLGEIIKSKAARAKAWVLGD